MEASPLDVLYDRVYLNTVWLFCSLGLLLVYGMRRELCFVHRKADRMENEMTKRGQRERKVGYEKERIIREGEGKKEKRKVREEERT
jgi:hypothetical protein